MDTNNEISSNGVNERTTQHSQLLPGNGTVIDQAGRNHYFNTGTTSIRKYIRQNNRVILKCNLKIFAIGDKCVSNGKN